MLATEKCKTFKALHAAGGFIMPNAWDAGSAVILAEQGFRAMATTSAGIAFALGKPDYSVGDRRLAVSREQMITRAAEIASAVKVPINADLEAGYGDAPEIVTETIRLAIAAGLAGANIEDKIPDRPGLYDETLAVERIGAARAAIAASGTDFVLTARTDPFLIGAPDALKESIRRGNLYLKAGADCVFPPGPVDVETVAALAREIDGPINIVMGLGQASGNARDMLAAGARRISLGGSIARSALGLVRRAARELCEQGSVTFAREQLGQGDLNAIFVRARGG